MTGIDTVRGERAKTSAFYFPMWQKIPLESNSVALFLVVNTGPEKRLFSALLCKVQQFYMIKL